MEDKSLQTKPVETAEEQEIDLIELAQKVWKEKKLFIKPGCIAVIVGLIIAFSLPKEYTTTVRLAPESAEPTNSMGNLGGLAAMAGINLNSVSGSDALSPDLYPDLVQSTPFLLELLKINVTNVKRELQTTVYDYMHEHQRKAWFGYVIRAPFELLGWVRELIGGKEDELISGETSGPIFLNRDEEKVLENLKERIQASVDKKTQVITVSVKMQDPLISARLTEVVMDQLQEYITHYRTQKAKQDLEFTESVFAEAKENYYKTQLAYAAFEDANRNIISASYRTEQERLKNEMSLTFNLYNTLAQKLEQDRLRVQERTPVYTVIEPAIVPLKPSFPKKIMILIGIVFLAVTGTIGYILFKDVFKREEVKS